VPFDEVHQGVEGSVADFLRWERHLGEVAAGIEIIEAALAARMELPASVENRAGPWQSGWAAASLPKVAAGAA
jgi:hypothetical protein